MALYWTLNDIPELGGLPRARQRELWRRARRRSMRRLPFWGAVVGSLLLVWPLATLADHRIAASDLPADVITFGALVALALLIMGQIITRVLGPVVVGWILGKGLELWLLGANAMTGDGLGLVLTVGVGGVLMSQLVTAALRPQLALERAALEPPPTHNDGSYWVPPAI